MPAANVASGSMTLEEAQPPIEPALIVDALVIGSACQSVQPGTPSVTPATSKSTLQVYQKASQQVF